MKMNRSIILCLVLIVVQSISARILSQCDIARELLQHGFPRHEMNDWVCLVLSESSGNTAAVGGPNSDGSHDYGLFQINDRYWCAHGKRGKDCNVDCGELLTDDIRQAVKCTKKIYKRHGFSAWHGWVRKCSGGQAPSVDHCF